jgi:hypothetical protein
MEVCLDTALKKFDGSVIVHFNFMSGVADLATHVVLPHQKDVIDHFLHVPPF